MLRLSDLATARADREVLLEGLARSLPGVARVVLDKPGRRRRQRGPARACVSGAPAGIGAARGVATATMCSGVAGRSTSSTLAGRPRPRCAPHSSARRGGRGRHRELCSMPAWWAAHEQVLRRKLEACSETRSRAAAPLRRSRGRGGPAAARPRPARGRGGRLHSSGLLEHGTAYIHKLAHLESAKPLSAGTTLSAALFEHRHRPRPRRMGRLRHRRRSQQRATGWNRSAHAGASPACAHATRATGRRWHKALARKLVSRPALARCGARRGQSG